MKKFFMGTFRFIGALLSLVKGLMVIGMVITGSLTAYLIYITAVTTIDQYNETLTWTNTAYDIPLAEIEPALIANTRNMDMVNAAGAWEELERYVESLDGNPISDRETAESLLNEAVKWQEIYHLDSDAIEKLSLYLELEDAITDAYLTFDTSRLQSLASQLHVLEILHPTDTGRKYMERIETVSSDFSEAKLLMTDTVLSVGKLEDGIWTIPYTYTRTDLSDVLEQLKTLQKFPAFRNISDTLSDVADVLNYNKNARDYFAYQDFKESVDRITRRKYVPISSIYTYEQAVEFGCNIQVEEQEGYTVSMQSPVFGVYYDGERLDDDQYVKNGAMLIAVIDPVYEPILYEDTEDVEYIEYIDEPVYEYSWEEDDYN